MRERSCAVAEPASATRRRNTTIGVVATNAKLSKSLAAAWR
jgi:L-aminopeptidase/D-esterase-like protein